MHINTRAATSRFPQCGDHVRLVVLAGCVCLALYARIPRYGRGACLQICRDPEHSPSHILSRPLGQVSRDVVVRSYLDVIAQARSLTGTFYRAGSGFKLNVQNLSSLTLNLGSHTTTPLVTVGVSLNYEPFYTVNVSAGTNPIPLTPSSAQAQKSSHTVVRINAVGWQDNRVNLDSIALNAVRPQTSFFQRLSFEHISLAISTIGRNAASLQALEARIPVHRRLSLSCKSFFAVPSTTSMSAN